jgi:colicin import membrane protein
VVTRAELAGRLKQAQAANPQQSVLIAGDRSVKLRSSCWQRHGRTAEAAGGEDRSAGATGGGQGSWRGDSPSCRRATRPASAISIALAVAVHLLLAAFLFYGVSWQTKAPDAVEVELVRATPEPPRPGRRAASADSRAATGATGTGAETGTAAAQTGDRNQGEGKAEAAAAPSRCPAAAPRVDPFQEQLKRETEQLTQRKQAESAAQELAQVKASQAAAARNKAIADYLGRIRGKIRGNIVLPPDIKGNPEAVFEVTQLPSGEIDQRQAEKILRPRRAGQCRRARHPQVQPAAKPEQSDLFSPFAEYPLPAPGRLGGL